MTTTMNEEDFPVLNTYDLALIGPGPITGYERDPETSWYSEYSGIRPSLLRECEDTINDLLPVGYRVEIRETEEKP